MRTTKKQRSLTSWVGFCLAGLLLVGATSATTAAQSTAEKAAPVQLVGLEVTAANGSGKFSTETLCKLTVLLENGGSQPAYSLTFEVSIGGQALPVYEKQVFMVPVKPKDGDDDAPFRLDLFNFWTSDSRRPAPADGKLDVSVTLTGAQWLEIGEEQNGQETVEVWTPKGAVPRLPSTVTSTIELTGSNGS